MQMGLQLSVSSKISIVNPQNTYRRSGAVFQLYAYLQSQAEQSESCKSATGLLLYPTVKQALSESVTIQGHQLRWETIGLTVPWEDIEIALIELANSLIP
jgi:5-methylcytosine-specific restriction enzyme subunit McrC